jgi:hypothetical protein
MTTRRFLAFALVFAAGFAAGHYGRRAEPRSAGPDWSADIFVVAPTAPGSDYPECRRIRPHYFRADGRAVKLGEPAPGDEVWTLTFDNERVVVAGTMPPRPAGQ